MKRVKKAKKKLLPRRLRRVLLLAKIGGVALPAMGVLVAAILAARRGQHGHF